MPANNEELLTQCVQYFKSNQGFKRMFEKIRDKYCSLGHLGGTINLDNLMPAEKEALSGFLCKDYYNKKSASITIESLIKALEKSKFCGVDFEDVLKSYFQNSLISKKEEKNLYISQKEKFFAEIIGRHEGTRAEKWLKSILGSKENAYKLISKHYDENPDILAKNLDFACIGVNRLSFESTNTVRLALFASEISKNPHCFDYDALAGKLLLYSASYFLNKPFPQNSEEKSELLYQAGIINDEISSFTTCSGLIGWKNGKPHPGWQGFYEYSEPMQLSLYNLSGIDYAACSNGKVFVFENPTIFTEVLYSTSHKKPSLICTYGQVKLASLVLLDKLSDHADNIYYSGDFDPEGLAIADKLKQRYGSKLTLWRYRIEDYLKIISEEPIDKIRLAKMDKLASPELKELASVIKIKGFSAYQELLTKFYIEDILKM